MGHYIDSIIQLVYPLVGVIIGGLITWYVLKKQQIREWRRDFLETVWMPLMKEVSRNHTKLLSYRFILAPDDVEYKRIIEENKDWVFGRSLYADLADFYEFSFSKMKDQYLKIRPKGRELVKEMLPPESMVFVGFRNEAIGNTSQYRFLGDEAVGFWLKFNWAAIHEDQIINIYDEIKSPLKLKKSYEEFRDEFKEKMFASSEWLQLDSEYEQTTSKAAKLRDKLAGIVGSYRRELELKD